MTSSAISQPVVYSPTPVVPMPDSPIFANRRHRTHEGAPQAIFDDNIWPLSDLDFSETKGAVNLAFAHTYGQKPDPVKVYFYNVLNTEMQRRTALTKVRFPAAGTVVHMYAAVRRLQAWMDKNQITSIAALSVNDWNHYAEVVASSDATYGHKLSQLIHLSRLWAHNVGLPSPYRFVMPPWFSTMKFNRWLGPAPRYYENRTEPFHPDTISALVVAAVTIINGYLDGSIAVGSRSITTEARQWFHDQGETLQKASLTAQQIARWKQSTGWVKPFDKVDVRSAAFVVIAYLTGMRTQEILHLERGCLTRTQSNSNDSRAGEYTIRGRVFKGISDENGDQRSEGVTRQQPWVTIEPAARAVEALERLARPDATYLFTTAYKFTYRTGMRVRHGDVTTSVNMAERLGYFVKVWNAHAIRSGLSPIPSDGDASVFGTTQSRVSTVRFRRTLAFHIANNPGGEVALGIQYGHVKGIISLGYAGRAESGFPDELEMDALLSGWGELDELTSELQSGSKVSGPAANRVREALSDFANQYAGQVQTESTLRRLQKSGLVLIHDNPDAHNVCAYVAATALCHPDRGTDAASKTPDLTNCQRGCPNIALLDSHTSAKARQRDRLLADIKSLPLPMADRNQQIADELSKEIRRHDQDGNR